jgi:hypothetical protein
VTVEARGFGLPTPLAVTGSGVTSLTSAELDLTFDLDPIVEAIAARTPEAALLGDGLKLRTLVKGSQVRMQLPRIPGLALPGGATWVGVDAGKAVEAFGVDARALTAGLPRGPRRPARGAAALGRREGDRDSGP